MTAALPKITAVIFNNIMCFLLVSHWIRPWSVSQWSTTDVVVQWFSLRDLRLLICWSADRLIISNSWRSLSNMLNHCWVYSCYVRVGNMLKIHVCIKLTYTLTFSELDLVAYCLSVLFCLFYLWVPWTCLVTLWQIKWTGLNELVICSNLYLFL